MLLGIAGDDIHFMIEILAFLLHAKNKAAGRFFLSCNVCFSWSEDYEHDSVSNMRQHEIIILITRRNDV